MSAGQIERKIYARRSPSLQTSTVTQPAPTREEVIITSTTNLWFSRCATLPLDLQRPVYSSPRKDSCAPCPRRGSTCPRYLRLPFPLLLAATPGAHDQSG